MAERSSLPMPDDGASDYVYRDGLTPTVRRCLLAGVVFFHVGAGWALSQVEPVKLIVGDIAPMEVRMVAAEEPAQPDLPSEEPPPPPELQPPPPPEVAIVIDPPPPDLPPPAFPLAMPDIPLPPDVLPPPEIPLAKVELPPPPELPPPEIPVEPKPTKPAPPMPAPPKPKPRPQQAAPAPRRAPPAEPAADSQPQQTAAAPAAPRTVSASQLGYLVAPSPAYPARSRKAGEEGLVTVRVLVDVTGRPAQVSLQKSSGHAALDAAAVSAVRAAQFRPYTERGLAQAVWVIVPINFVLR